MSTIHPGKTTAETPLVAGQRLDQAEFHRRYEAMPSDVRAELIDGVVYIPSPVSREHGHADVNAIGWLMHYRRHTPGVEVLGDATTILGRKSEPQPDVQLRILPECGGQSRNQGPYVGGAPELVVEVAKATRYVDLGPKLADYERAGVLEYLVRALDPDEVLWFALRDRAFIQVSPDADGLYRSSAFPGLWLNPAALLSDDLDRLFAALDLGLATPQHAAFVARLANARESS
ncbi:MAG: Uma2 family endonuclease [Isosphaeraceae bacterium]